MSTTAQKWGNSIGVRVPYKIAKEFDIEKGTEIEFMPAKDGIIMKPVKEKPTLDELLAECEGKNPNPEYFAEPIGSESL